MRFFLLLFRLIHQICLIFGTKVNVGNFYTLEFLNLPDLPIAAPIKVLNSASGTNFQLRSAAIQEGLSVGPSVRLSNNVKNLNNSSNLCPIDLNEVLLEFYVLQLSFERKNSKFYFGGALRGAKRGQKTPFFGVKCQKLESLEKFVSN